jgi:flagellar biosynthetic protein FliR
MERILGDMYARFPLYMLVGLRLTGLFIMSPVFGKRGMPAGAKIGLAVLLTYLILPVLLIEPSYRLFNLFAFTLECIKEFILGLALGYITTVFFSVVMTAGELIDNQIGFGMVRLFDPQSSMQVPLFGNFLNVLAMMLFLSVDGHHTLIRILCSSFSRIPPGKIVISPVLGTMAAEYFTATFVLAVQIALPVVAAALMAETALAVIMRTVPQMNVFVVGIPLKVMLGIIVMLVILPVYKIMMGNIFDQMNTAVVHFFEGFASP